MKTIKSKLEEALALTEQYIIGAVGETKELASTMAEKIRSSISGADTIISQEATLKKKNVVYGEFRLPGGRFDFEPGIGIPLVMEGKKFTIICDLRSKMEAQFADFLKKTWNIQDSDMLLNRWFLSTLTDTLTFCFAFKTDLDFKDSSDIAIETPALRAYGVLNFNKAYLRAPELTIFPDGILEYKLKGFAVPYALESDPAVLLGKLKQAADHNGDLADLRGFGLPYKPAVDAFVAELKQKKWNAIYTQWGRHKRLGDGTYRSF